MTNVNETPHEKSLDARAKQQCFLKALCVISFAAFNRFPAASNSTVENLQPQFFLP
jgi:hypothetical protein